ncbi:MAG: hypothetical protein Q8930_08945 [Bacillota bacterium]|nr:hypothetical protein [Bacillota bacterium]
MSQVLSLIIPLIFSGICLNVIYVIVHSAMNDGTLEALKEKNNMKKRTH